MKSENLPQRVDQLVYIFFEQFHKKPTRNKTMVLQMVAKITMGWTASSTPENKYAV